MKNGSVPFAEAFDRLQATMDMRFINPIWNLTELFSTQKSKDLKTLRDFCGKIVKQRRCEPAEAQKDKFDILSLFMKVKDPEGNFFDDKALTEHVLNFIIAGRDTTAQALSWTFFYLSQNPAALKKLQDEIQETLGNNSKPTYEQIKGMKYANAVFLEALRLSPSVPKNAKSVVEDDMLPDGISNIKLGTPLPAGSVVLYSTFIMARDTKIWGPDACEFNPDRWIGAKVPSPFEYVVFNAGPRICLGKAFAELEGVFAIVSLCKIFEISVVEPEKVHYGNSLTFPMRDGLKVKVALRK